MKKSLLLVFFGLALALSGCFSNPEETANRLFSEASAAIQKAQSPSASSISGLSNGVVDAHTKINAILEEYPSTSVAVGLHSGSLAVGGLSYSQLKSAAKFAAIAQEAPNSILISAYITSLDLAPGNPVRARALGSILALYNRNATLDVDVAVWLDLAIEELRHLDLERSYGVEDLLLHEIAIALAKKDGIDAGIDFASQNVNFLNTDDPASIDHALDLIALRVHTSLGELGEARAVADRIISANGDSPRSTNAERYATLLPYLYGHIDNLSSAIEKFSQFLAGVEDPQARMVGLTTLVYYSALNDNPEMALKYAVEAMEVIDSDTNKEFGYYQRLFVLTAAGDSIPDQLLNKYVRPIFESEYAKDRDYYFWGDNFSDIAPHMKTALLKGIADDAFTEIRSQSKGYAEERSSKIIGEIALSVAADNSNALPQALIAAEQNDDLDSAELAVVFVKQGLLSEALKLIRASNDSEAISDALLSFSLHPPPIKHHESDYYWGRVSEEDRSTLLQIVSPTIKKTLRLHLIE